VWQTDGRTHDDSKYRASIASRGKNAPNEDGSWLTKELLQLSVANRPDVGWQ